MDSPIAEQALDEAISALGLVSPVAKASLLPLLPRCATEHPKAVATAYRKAGEQISDVEKRQLGIRRNGFMSVAARSELTSRGEEAPLDAHLMTLMRAQFTIFRASRIAEASRIEGARLRHEGAVVRPCFACDRVKGEIVSSPFPPPGCEVAWCPASVRIEIDFLSQLADEPPVQVGTSTNLWRRFVALIAKR